MRLSGTTGEVFGGLVEKNAEDGARLDILAPILLACGRWVSAEVRGQGTIGELQTRVRHLIAEHDTLKAAHTESISRSIEEHDNRLREEKAPGDGADFVPRTKPPIVPRANSWPT